jgi:hypothetical protein
MRNERPLVIILIGLVGCLLTSSAGITGYMIYCGWDSQGGWFELFHRLSISYPCSSLVVFFIFPWLIPRLTRYIRLKIISVEK